MACVVVVGRISAALEPGAASGRVGGSVTLVAGDLGAADTQSAVGFDGPGRHSSIDPSSPGTTRVWFAGGRWWGLFPNAQASSMRIWALAGPDGPWVDSGVVVDDRADARVDVAWTGTHLVVSASGTRPYRSEGLRLSRFSYGEDGWSRDPDFPVTLTNSGVPDTQLAVTDDGRVWLARTEGNAVVVSSSDTANQRFSDFAPLPGGVAGTDVGGFDLESAGEGLLVVWRSVSSDTLVAARGDAAGVWSEIAHPVYGVGGVGPLDAVIAGASQPGLVLVALDTTLGVRGSNEEDPAIVLARLRGSTTEVSVVAKGLDRLGPPSLVVDPGAGKVHVLAVASPADEDAPADPANPDVWSVTDKVADLAEPEFGSGQGTVLIRREGVSLWPPAVPAELVDAIRGFVVATSGDDASQWTSTQIGGSAPAGPAPTGSGARAIVLDTFETRAPGPGAPGGWYASGSAPLQASISATGVAPGRSLVLANTDGGSAPTACRALTPTGSQRLVVQADVTSVGWGTADARLLTLKGSDGTLVSARLTKRGQGGWAATGTRVAQGLVADATPLRVTITVDPTAGTAQVRLAVQGGAVVAEGAAVPLLSAATDGVDQVCLTPAPGNPQARIELDDLTVTPG